MGKFFMLPLKGAPEVPPEVVEKVIESTGKKGKIKMSFMVGSGVRCATSCRLYKEQKCFGMTGSKSPSISKICQKVLDEEVIVLGNGVCPKEYYIG